MVAHADLLMRSTENLQLRIRNIDCFDLLLRGIDDENLGRHGPLVLQARTIDSIAIDSASTGQPS